MSDLVTGTSVTASTGVVKQELGSQLRRRLSVFLVNLEDGINRAELERRGEARGHAPLVHRACTGLLDRHFSNVTHPTKGAMKAPERSTFVHIRRVTQPQHRSCSNGWQRYDALRSRGLIVCNAAWHRNDNASFSKGASFASGYAIPPCRVDRMWHRAACQPIGKQARESRAC